MADVRPFRALRPPPELAAAVSAPPYDVVSTAEARELARSSPESFLHVSRPEIDLPDGTEPDSPAVHARGRSALADLVGRGVLVRDAAPTLTVYRQVWRGRVQTGVVCCVAVDDYVAGVVRTHEHTRPDKEADRVHHVDALSAHDEPVFLLAPRDAAVAAALDAVTARDPEVAFTADDGVEHRLWVVSDAAVIDLLVRAYAAMPHLYVADGHHRSAAAHRVRDLRVAEGRFVGESDAFLAVVFAADEPTVLAYHRVVVDLARRTADQLLDALRDSFDVVRAPGPVDPQRRGEFGVYVDGAWYRLTARPGPPDSDADSDADSDSEDDVVARLDVSVLQDRVLAPLLGIADPRTDPRIRFVGGIRGTGELQRLVDEGEAAVAFSLFPTSVDDLLAVADRGEVMPPKSTWFEPKLRSGLVVHPFDP